jgi:nucleoside-diphosphate-sugar epimerase
MPTIVPGDKVLVSGANGFIASWLVRTLLEQGYAVRGSVRSLAKGRHLQELFKEYDKFELVVVEDIAKVCTVGHCQIYQRFEYGTEFRKERLTKL